jgi:hypothetical protein
MQLPGLTGFAYRFTIFFPLLSGLTGGGIFTVQEAAELGGFLNDVFGGCSIEKVGNYPPLTGLWKKGKTMMIDGHTRIVVYTAQKDEAEQFFLRLKSSLEQASGEEIILIEKATVTILG